MSRRLALLLGLALAAPAVGAPRSKRPARPPRRAAPAAPRPSAPVEAPPAPKPAEPPVDALLFGFGAELEESAGGLTVLATRPGSRAEELGLRPGDRLHSLDRRPAPDRAVAAAALRAWTPGSRLSAVVRRGYETRVLESPSAPRPAPFERGAADLSARERALAAERQVQDDAAAAAAVRSSPLPVFTARADQAVWVRFPKGLPAAAKTGDLVEAEVATGLTTDASLDFLSIPPKSRLWARVVEAGADAETRSVRLAFYKLAVAGGAVYPLSGAATGVSGDQAAARVSAGGTLVVAAPLPDPSGSRPWPDLLDADARLRVRLLEPVALVEPPSYWRAGPGLWLKTSERDGKRLFEVSHVTPGRAAAAAGIKPGDLVDAVDGRGSARLEFADALDRLYGAPGTKVSVSVLRDGRSKRHDLLRGTAFDAAGSSALPLPVRY
ncbi:MAG: PDZ domain-containing protein [Elusimicrobiota bacterium]|nr:PDZ domain-containing protein [Elusimicrobiota bacterium]